MFEHWKAYKNRQNENLNGDPTTAKHSRAESFASLVSVIRKRIQISLPVYFRFTSGFTTMVEKYDKSKGLSHARSQLSLRPGETSTEFDLIKNENLPDLVKKQQSIRSSGNYNIMPSSLRYYYVIITTHYLFPKRIQKIELSPSSTSRSASAPSSGSVLAKFLVIKKYIYGQMPLRNVFLSVECH